MNRLFPFKSIFFFPLGLDQLHNLTSSSPIRYELRVDLRTANESAYAVYDFFQVASSRERYRLSVGNYRGNAGEECLRLVRSLLHTGEQILGTLCWFCQ